MKNQKENSKNVQRSILFSPPDISDLEIAEVVEALKSGWITTGPRTKELEKRLAGFCHTSKVFEFCNSCGRIEFQNLWNW